MPSTVKRILFLFICLLSLSAWSQSTLNALNSMHVVKKGETMYSIARQYGVSVEELQRSNPDVKDDKIKSGRVLHIPQKPIQGQVPTVAVEQAPKPAPQPAAKTHYEHLNVGVLLPFEEQSERSAKFIEFYQGLLMAADSVRSQGIHLDIYAWNYEGAQTVATLKQEPELATMNVIISASDASLASFCAEQNIPVVFPFSHSLNLSNYPTLYSATTNYAAVAQMAAKLVIDTKASRNFVFLTSSQPDQRGAAFTEALRHQLKERGIATRSLNLEADNTAWEMNLLAGTDNCIIPDNTSLRTLNIVVSRLNEFMQTHPEHHVSLQGFPEWQAYTSSTLKDLYSFDTYIYSTYYKNPLAPRTQEFERAFYKNFHRPMIASIPQYGMMGFDLGYYFMHGLSAYGDHFQAKQNAQMITPYQNPFYFERLEGGTAGFSNTAVELIHYTTNMTLEVITPNR